jgi:hypothetical protein
MKPQQTNYAGGVHDALRAASAWRLVAMVLSIVSIVTIGMALRASGTQRTVLVPYGMYSANNQVTVDGSLRDADYLMLLARADASALLDWQPRTVERQIEAFLSRLTPGAYSRYNLTLRSEAKKYAELNASEVFYPSSVSFTPPNQVVLTGAILRYIGEQKGELPGLPASGTDPASTPAGPSAESDITKSGVASQVTYTFTYVESNGVYGLDKVETKQ